MLAAAAVSNAASMLSVQYRIFVRARYSGNPAKELVTTAEMLPCGESMATTCRLLSLGMLKTYSSFASKFSR
jgi:hypothetical protein